VLFPVWAVPKPVSLPPLVVVVLNQSSTESVCGLLKVFPEATRPVDVPFSVTAGLLSPVIAPATPLVTPAE
jgi:hypothetical protein